MKRILKFTGYAALVALVIVAYCGYRIVFGKPFTLNELANRQTLLYLLADPETFTGVGLIDGTVFDHHSDKLTSVGPARLAEEYAMAAKFSAQVRQFDRDKLDRQQQITYDVLLEQYATMLSFKRFAWLSSEGSDNPGPGLYPIAPMWGTQTALPAFLETQHVVRNLKTARNYVRRLRSSGGKLDAATAEMMRQANLGVVLPPALSDRAQGDIREITKPLPADSPLVTDFVRQMKQIKGLGAARQAQFAAEAITAVSDDIYPAYARMLAALEQQRPATLDRAAGVGSLPDGRAYYAASLKQMTTTDYTPQQIHALGLSEVARVGAQMDALLKSQGLIRGSLGERMHALHTDPRFLFPDTDSGREQLLARYRQILDEINDLMPRYFRIVPTQKLVVERMPVAAEKGAALAQYQDPAQDGSRPGVFAVNLRDVTETSTWAMKTLAYHEGIPGHHFQISIAQGLADLPLIREEIPYAAYQEGWALYAEQLAAEIGMYKDDPFGDLGRLEGEMLRSARLVVDTGLHAQDWSREQAINYMVNVGINESEASTEVERYMGMPGQACAYKIGELKILELRDRAKAALGSKFDLREFHSVILGYGALPLTVLENLVNEWIAAKKG